MSRKWQWSKLQTTLNHAIFTFLSLHLPELLLPKSRACIQKFDCSCETLCSWCLRQASLSYLTGAIEEGTFTSLNADSQIMAWRTQAQVNFMSLIEAG